MRLTRIDNYNEGEERFKRRDIQDGEPCRSSSKGPSYLYRERERDGPAECYSTLSLPHLVHALLAKLIWLDHSIKPSFKSRNPFTTSSCVYSIRGVCVLSCYPVRGCHAPPRWLWPKSPPLRRSCEPVTIDSRAPLCLCVRSSDSCLWRLHCRLPMHTRGPALASHNHASLALHCKQQQAQVTVDAASSVISHQRLEKSSPRGLQAGRSSTSSTLPGRST